MNQKYLYEKLTAEKDLLHNIVNRMKRAWTRDVWVQLHHLMGESNFIAIRDLLLKQRVSKSRHDALECVDHIIRLSAKLHFAY